MSFEIERDLNDMDKAITELESVISDLDFVLDKKLLEKLTSVVSEWGYTRHHVIELLNKAS